MPEARNGSRLLVEQPRMCPLLFTVYTRLPVRPYTRTEKNMRIKIETIQSDVCVHSRIKAFNIGKGIDTRSDRKRLDSAIFFVTWEWEEWELLSFRSNRY